MAFELRRSWPKSARRATSPALPPLFDLPAWTGPSALKSQVNGRCLLWHLAKLQGQTWRFFHRQRRTMGRHTVGRVPSWACRRPPVEGPDSVFSRLPKGLRRADRRLRAGPRDAGRQRAEVGGHAGHRSAEEPLFLEKWYLDRPIIWARTAPNRSGQVTDRGSWAISWGRGPARVGGSSLHGPCTSQSPMLQWIASTVTAELRQVVVRLGLGVVAVASARRGRLAPMRGVGQLLRPRSDRHGRAPPGSAAPVDATHGDPHEGRRILPRLRNRSPRNRRRRSSHAAPQPMAA